MWKRKLLLGALAAASIGMTSVPATAAVGIYVDVAPPAPRYEGYGDRDRDGIPNRVDRDRDGVPNRFDRAPDNPRRQ